MSATLFSRAELDAAVQLVAANVLPTPQHRWPLACARAGCDVWLKHENHTATGAFKIRGGLVYVNNLLRGVRPRGLVTATRGNHGQSIPFAAARYDLPVTVLVPRGNSVEKNAAMRGWGARLVEHGVDFDEARVEAERLADEQGLLFVPSFHRDLVVGVATYAYELFTAVERLDAVYVPIGMGSGICGLITVRDLLGLDTEIVGVVASAAPAIALSFDARRIVETDTAASFVDGIACRAPMQAPLDIILRGASHIVQVSEDEVADAMRSIFEDTHNVAEPAGAAAFAGLMQERDSLRGKRVAAIVTGANVDSDVLRQVLDGETPPP